MAKRYVVDGRVRAVNAVVRTMAQLGISGRRVSMTTAGRRSGDRRSVPVTPVDVEGKRYIVSPYGEVGWVHNVRSNPHVELRRGSRTERAVLTELPAGGRAPILEAYVATEEITRPYFGVPERPTTADFAAVAAAHPVFVIEPDQ